jgi:hypothetical protein
MCFGQKAGKIWKKNISKRKKILNGKKRRVSEKYKIQLYSHLGSDKCPIVVCNKEIEFMKSYKYKYENNAFSIKYLKA